MFTALGAFMSSITAQLGDLIDLIASAVETYGEHLLAASFIEGSSNTPGTMDFLAYAYFTPTGDEGGPGLVYWINDKLMYWIEYIKTNADWTNFGAFLTALADAGLI